MEAVAQCSFPAMTAFGMELMKRRGWPTPTLATYQLALVCIRKHPAHLHTAANFSPQQPLFIVRDCHDLAR